MSSVDSPAAASDEAPAGSSNSALETRYGRGRRRRIDRRFAIIAAVGLIIAGLVYLFASGWHTTNQVEWQDIGKTVRGDGTVDVKFEVTAPSNASVACAIEGLNTSKATVGWKVVELPQTETRTHTVTTNLRTTSPATATSVRECWVLEQ